MGINVLQGVMSKRGCGNLSIQKSFDDLQKAYNYFYEISDKKDGWVISNGTLMTVLEVGGVFNDIDEIEKYDDYSHNVKNRINKLLGHCNISLDIDIDEWFRNGYLSFNQGNDGWDYLWLLDECNDCAIRLSDGAIIDNSKENILGN